MRSLVTPAVARGAIVGLGIVTLLVGAPAAVAGTVSGTVEIKPSKLGSPPVRGQGFLERSENPLIPTRPFTPFPAMIVVLDGGTPDDADKSPPKEPVRYDLLGESFDGTVQPVVAGSTVEIKNRGIGAPVLYSPDAESLFDGKPLNPTEPRAVTIGKEGLVRVRARGNPHLIGRIVALPHRYYSLVDAGGGFSIADVPPGTWKVKIWHQDRWLDIAEQTVEVGRGRAKIDPVVKPSAFNAPGAGE